jgi:hypothetical protein
MPMISPREVIEQAVHSCNAEPSGMRVLRFVITPFTPFCQMTAVGMNPVLNDAPTTTPASLMPSAPLLTSPGRGPGRGCIPVALLQMKAPKVWSPFRSDQPTTWPWLFRFLAKIPTPWPVPPRFPRSLGVPSASQSMA